MSIWNLFKSEAKDESFSSNLQAKLSTLMPNSSEEDLSKIACISGLMARVALVDMVLDQEELKSMRGSLGELTNFTDDQIKAIVETATTEVKELAGLENHKYTQNLADVCGEDEKMEILYALFALAAADGNADNLESEEIRTITKGLKLSNQHFLAARATVVEKLGALKE